MAKKEIFDFGTSSGLSLSSMDEYEEKFSVEDEKQVSVNKGEKETVTTKSHPNKQPRKVKKESRKRDVEKVVVIKTNQKSKGRRQLPDMVEEAHLKKLGLRRLEQHFDTPYNVKTVAVPPEILEHLKEISEEVGVKVKHLVANILNNTIERFNK